MKPPGNMGILPGHEKEGGIVKALKAGSIQKR